MLVKRHFDKKKISTKIFVFLLTHVKEQKLFICTQKERMNISH